MTTRRTLAMVRELWEEVTYAHRRLLEIRMGALALSPRQRRIRAQIDELEALYSRECPRL
jgi:hypothetical protein